MEPQNYAVLGVHSPQDPEGNPLPGSTTVRVRMFVGDKAVDEDFVMPRIITIEEQVHNAVQDRIEELAAGVSPVESKLTVADGDQVVNEKFFMPEDNEMLPIQPPDSQGLVNNVSPGAAQ